MKIMILLFLVASVSLARADCIDVPDNSAEPRCRVNTKLDCPSIPGAACSQKIIKECEPQPIKKVCVDGVTLDKQKVTIPAPVK